MHYNQDKIIKPDVRVDSAFEFAEKPLWSRHQQREEILT
jgi:hypothetical protein